MAESPASPGAITTPASPAMMPDTISEGVGVVVRVRPLSTKERADPSVHNCIQALSDIIVIDPNARRRPASVDGKGMAYTTSSSAAAAVATPASQPIRSSKRPYQFSVDHVFHTHSSQIEVYEESCKRIVEGVFQGINGSILVYGATGSGKTHTMFGSNMSAAGIVYQAVQDIFAEKERLEEEEGKRVRIKCNFLEVYNGEVFDLLVKADGGNGAASSTACGPRQSKRVPLQVRETGLSEGDARGSAGSGSGGLHLPGLSHLFPETLEDFTRGIEHGHAQRFVAATGANAQSSRSHAILTVEVEVRDDPALAATADSSPSPTAMGPRDEDSVIDGQPLHSKTNTLASDGASTVASPVAAKAAKRKKQPASTVTIASIQFGDLAGSERAATTSNTGLRLREGGNINRSLLALGAVVQSLAQQKAKERQTGGKGGSKMFIPYRGSKLTRLLRDGIGGNCRTMMLFCVSPSTKQIEETVNTMKFAMNAREIQVVARRNEFAVNSSQLAKTQEVLIEELRAELARTHAALAYYTGEEWGANEVKEAGSGSPMAVAKRENPSGCDRQMSLDAVEYSTAVNTGNGINNSEDGTSRFGSATTPLAPPQPSTPCAVPPRGTLTPSTSAGGGRPANPSISPLSASAVEVSASVSTPRASLSSRAARPSVFAENTRHFSDLEAKLKDFSAQKESLYHEVRDAEERKRDGDAQLRDLQWRLAAFLVSDAYGSRARGETDPSNVNSTVGVAGLRKTIASLEEAQMQQASQLKELTTRLEEADRQFAATRKALLRERQGTALELLLDNARLRQGCTEAECLAAHYHQECRSLLNDEAEYAEALSKCVGALQQLRPILTRSLNSSRLSGADVSSAAAALEVADVALLFALLPTASTAQRMQTFESALRSTAVVQQPHSPEQEKNKVECHPSLSLAFAHPPLAPSPTNRSGSGSSSLSPTRVCRSASTPLSNQLAEHFRDLVATAESMHLTGGSDGAHAAAAAERNGGRSGTRTRRGNDPSAPALSRAFAYTVSLTGLTATRPTSAAADDAKNEKTASSSVAPPEGPRPVASSSAVRHKGVNGPSAPAGSVAKRSIPSSGAAAPRLLQRSLTAPMQLSRSASARVTPGGGGGRAGAKPKAPGNKAKTASSKPSTSTTTNGGLGGSSNNTAQANNAATPEKQPSKSGKALRAHPSYRLSPKAMWSVAGTNSDGSRHNNSVVAGTTAFARSNTVKVFGSPKKQFSNAEAGVGLLSLPQDQRLAADTAAPLAKVAPRASVEVTPRSSGSVVSSSHPSKEQQPLTVSGRRTGITGLAGCRKNGKATPPAPRGKGRHGLAGGAEGRRGVAQKLLRSKKSIAAATMSSVDLHTPSSLDPRYSQPLSSSCTTLSPMLLSSDSLGGGIDDAGRLCGLYERRNGSLGDANPSSAKDRRQTTTTSSIASSLDSSQCPLQDGQARLTVARLLECSSTVPPMMYYSTHSPLYPGDSGVNFNKENQQCLAVQSRQRNSLPDDMTVSRSTVFSDSPLKS
ncbi:putative kinesin [Leptomonas seymouri]|uniref:Putative kinesin n=1 Tax=Leptomonas seymouri TaxID=5684 RepID=A0A0N0P6H8_LEPSE|nr:putative kinesin [Leptomonas seymouri]|eukprot:KPI87177.1 putative kinesin [Leptomonas seymouri]